MTKEEVALWDRQKIMPSTSAVAFLVKRPSTCLFPLQNMKKGSL